MHHFQEIPLHIEEITNTSTYGLPQCVESSQLKRICHHQLSTIRARLKIIQKT